MDELDGSDTGEPTAKTTIEVKPVGDKTIRAISMVLDEVIDHTWAETRKRKEGQGNE